MNKMFRARESGRAKAKECLPGQIFTEGLDTARYDLGRCNSAEEHLLPKQDVVGSNPITRSMKLSDSLPKSKRQS